MYLFVISEIKETVSSILTTIVTTTQRSNLTIPTTQLTNNPTQVPTRLETGGETGDKPQATVSLGGISGTTQATGAPKYKIMSAGASRKPYATQDNPPNPNLSTLSTKYQNVPSKTTTKGSGQESSKVGSQPTTIQAKQSFTKVTESTQGEYSFTRNDIYTPKYDHGGLMNINEPLFEFPDIVTKQPDFLGKPATQLTKIQPGELTGESTVLPLTSETLSTTTTPTALMVQTSGKLNPSTTVLTGTQITPLSKFDLAILTIDKDVEIPI